MRQIRTIKIKENGMLNITDGASNLSGNEKQHRTKPTTVVLLFTVVVRVHSALLICVLSTVFLIHLFSWLVTQFFLKFLSAPFSLSVGGQFILYFDSLSSLMRCTWPYHIYCFVLMSSYYSVSNIHNFSHPFTCYPILFRFSCRPSRVVHFNGY